MKQVFAVVLALLAAPVAAIEITLCDPQRWVSLSFRNIPANGVSVADCALQISVRKSASPLVYKLEEPATATGVTLEGRWSGELRIPAGVVQGDPEADDFVLKLGIVEAGDRTLNWLQRRLAADWVRQLFKLAPKGTGVERINFLSTTQQQSLVGSSRTHPLNDLLHETRIVDLESPGALKISHRFAKPVVVLGLWISADGDDTGSSFDLRIERITLHTD